MNTSRDMESVNGVEVVSSKTSQAEVRAKRTYAEITKPQQSRNYSDSFLKIMKKTVLHHRIPYWNEKETKGDGNCFYNAIIDQIHNNPGVYDTLSEDAKQCSTPSELRAAVITFIASWPEVLSKQETLNIWRESGLGEEGIDWERYIHKHGKNGIYADDLVIQCTATFLAKDIYVTTHQNKEVWTHINSYAGNKGLPITLASNQSSEKDDNGQLKIGGEHFQSLIPTAKKDNEWETCRNCAKNDIKRLKQHLNTKPSCKALYDMETMEAQAKAVAREKAKERVAKHRDTNRESINAKQAKYVSQHREQKAEYTLFFYERTS